MTKPNFRIKGTALLSAYWRGDVSWHLADALLLTTHSEAMSLLVHASLNN